MMKRILASAGVLLAGFGPAIAQQPIVPSPTAPAKIAAPIANSRGPAAPVANSRGPVAQMWQSATVQATPKAQTPPASPMAPGIPVPPATLAAQPTPLAQPAPYAHPAAPVSTCGQPGCTTCGTVDGCFTASEGLCGPGGQVWARGEYLLWWTKNGTAPALVSAGPPGSGAVLGQSGTTTLFDGGDNPTRHGARFTMGAWIDCDHILGVQVSYLFLGRKSNNFTAGGTGDPGTQTISRPFFDVGLQTENAELVAQQGVVQGTVAVNSALGFQGWAPDILYNICCDCNYRLDATAGFRYYQLDEDLRIQENLVTLAGSSVPAGTRFQVNDRFDTRNYFYGGALGLQGEYRRGRIFAQGHASVALGSTHQVVNVRGDTSITPPGATTAVGTGGLLAQPSNIGRRTRDEFGIIPEVGVRLGMQVTDQLRASVGYNFLYWNDVVRPGDQIDRGIDTRQLFRTGAPTGATGASRPAPLFKSSDFWAQGVTFNLEFRY